MVHADLPADERARPVRRGIVSDVETVGSAVACRFLPWTPSSIRRPASESWPSSSGTAPRRLLGRGTRWALRTATWTPTRSASRTRGTSVGGGCSRQAASKSGSGSHRRETRRSAPIWRLCGCIWHSRPSSRHSPHRLPRRTVRPLRGAHFSIRSPMRDAMPGRLSFDRVAAIYDETRRLAPRTMARVLAVLVDELRGKRVLEVGVGTGRYAVPLQKSGIRLVGVDISRKMVEFGLAKGLRDVVFADAARLPFVSGSFDVATTNHVLHLIPDWRDVLREIARVTRETYFTVIERSDRVDTLKREYDALVKDAGHAWSHPGFHEKDLPTLLKPDFVMPVGPFRETLLANSILEELNRRTYSSQWDVPEEIHRDAIERLRTNEAIASRGARNDPSSRRSSRTSVWRPVRRFSRIGSSGLVGAKPGEGNGTVVVRPNLYA